MTPELKRNLVIGFVAVFVFAPLLWMLMDREVPFQNYVGTITPSTPKAGEWIEVRWQIKVNRVCPGAVQREIVDSQGVICRYDVQPASRYDQLSSARPGQAPNVINRSFPVCASATPGPARYRAYVCYVCNPIHWLWPICVRTPDVPFTIAPEEKPSR